MYLVNINFFYKYILEMRSLNTAVVVILLISIIKNSIVGGGIPIIADDTRVQLKRIHTCAIQRD